MASHSFGKPIEARNRYRKKRKAAGTGATKNDAARGAESRATGERFLKTPGPDQKPRKGWTASRFATISAAVGLPCIALAIAIFVAL